MLPKGEKGFPLILMPTPPCPDCGAPWEPICQTKGCKGRTVAIAVTSFEREKTRYHREPERVGTPIEELRRDLARPKDYWLPFKLKGQTRHFDAEAA